MLLCCIDVFACYILYDADLTVCEQPLCMSLIPNMTGCNTTSTLVVVRTSSRSAACPLHVQRHPLHAQRHPLHAPWHPLHAQRHGLHALRHPLHAQRHPLHASRHPLHALRRPLRRHASLQSCKELQATAVLVSM